MTDNGRRGRGPFLSAATWVALAFCGGHLRLAPDARGDAAPLTFIQEAKLQGRAAPSVGSTNFGGAVSLEGDTAVVGASLEGAGDTQSGSAYVFVRSGTVWTEQRKLFASDSASSDAFGHAVSLSGDTVAVAAHRKHVGQAFNAGAVYVFARAGTSWTEQQKLVASDGAQDDTFGMSVALSGDTLVIGAGNVDTAAGTNAGAAYVFVRSGTTWAEQQKLVAPDGVMADRFGWRVAISGETVAVAADRANTAGGFNAGAVYVFVRSGTTWGLQQKVVASDGAANDYFSGVSLFGDTLVVGADGDDTPRGADSGSAYVFERSGTSWLERQKLIGSDSGSADTFGWATAVQADTIVVGTPNEDTASATDAGAAYVFARSGGSWIERAKLLASDGGNIDWLGIAVSVSGDTVLAGASLADASDGASKGAAYVFRDRSLVADLAVSQTDSPDPVVGLQPVTYTINASNLGPERADSVSVVDTLPAGTTFSSAGGDGWTCDEAAGAVTCTRLSLTLGAAPPINVVVTAPSTAGSLTNMVSVAHSGVDPLPANDSDSETTTVTAAPAADLSVAVSDGGVEARWGQPFAWTITVTNAGPDTATNAGVSDTFPVGVAGVSWTCSASPGSSCPASGTGNITAPVTLQAGGSTTFTATGTVVPGTASLTNTAAVMAPTGMQDPDAANNSATVTTAAGPIRYYTLTPCRVTDTRTEPSPLAANSTRTFPVGGECGVPADARAVAVILTAVNPGDVGNLRLYPTGQPLPQASAINFVAGRTRANNAVLPLGTAGQIDVRCDMPPGSTATTHFVLDAFGYFR